MSACNDFIPSIQARAAQKLEGRVNDGGATQLSTLHWLNLKYSEELADLDSAHEDAPVVALGPIPAGRNPLSCPGPPE